MNKVTDKRVEEIIKLLLTKDIPITIEDISKALGVSNRTIRNDLDKLETYLTVFKEDIQLIKKPRIGIWLKYTDMGLNKLNNLKDISSIYIEPYSSEERQKHMIKKLIQAQSPIPMQTIADELFVSRVTIYKDLKHVERQLGKYGLELVKKQKFGVEIKGNEASWRRAASDLITNNKKEQELKEIFSQSLVTLPNSRLNQYDIHNIKELIPHIEIFVIEKIITEAEKKLTYLLSDEAFTGLLIHIAISIERLKQNKDIKMNQKHLQDIKNHEEFTIATWIGSKIEKELNISMPPSELGYITLHILGAKPMEPVDIGNNKDSLIQNIEPEILEVTKEIILLIENILSVNLINDHNLLVGLGLHLRTAVNRLKYGLSMRNPLLEKIKENYPSIFGATWATSIIFEKHFSIRITEEEIGYIAIHIGAALERLNTKTKAIVVCSTGVGTSQLVVSRLENRIKNLEIVGVSSLHDISKYDPTQFDMIISTIPMAHDTKPVVKINVFVHDQDIRAINNYIKDCNTNKKINNSFLGVKIENHLFHRDLIFTKCHYKNKEELMKTLGTTLVEKGYTKKSFIQSAIRREEITSTAVGRGVAIPHGQEKHIITPVITVAILEKPIDWSGTQVDIVFLLALQFENGQDTKNFFKKFYALLDSEEKLNEIRNTFNSEQLFQLLIDM